MTDKMQIDSKPPKRITAKDKDQNENYQKFLKDVFGFKKTPATDKQRVGNTPTVIKEKISKWEHHPDNLAAGTLSAKDIQTRLWTINQWQNWHLAERSTAMRRINKAKKAAENGGVTGLKKTTTKAKKGKVNKSDRKENAMFNATQPMMLNGMEDGQFAPGSREELLAIHDELIASLREFEDDTARHMRRIKDITIALNRASADISN